MGKSTVIVCQSLNKNVTKEESGQGTCFLTLKHSQDWQDGPRERERALSAPFPTVKEKIIVGGETRFP